jgi:hypothetical protein
VHRSYGALRLMAHQILPHPDVSRGLKEVLETELGELKFLQQRLSGRLAAVERRIGPLQEQVAELEQQAQAASALGGDHLLSVSPPILLNQWLEVKRKQLQELNVEREQLKLVAEPVDGRIRILDYFADKRFDGGFNEALGLRLPVVITNGQAWMSVFLLLTGMHSLHLIAGLVLFAWFLPQRLDRSKAPNFYVATMYWQFVDVVWLAIFWIMYF